MQIPVGKPRQPAEETPPRRRSFFGKIFRGTGWLMTAPVTWLGADRIKHGWSLIGDLFGLLRSGPTQDDRFKTGSGSMFDLPTTAFSFGLTVRQIEAQLAARRRQTARISYAALALGVLFLVGWIWHALSSPWTATRLSSALYFLPFCAVFFLVAFYNALLNFQIRSGRLASWLEYLETSDGFWPN